MKNACLSVIAVALAATSAFAYPQYAPTCEEDIRAAILFREENMNKSARWESALKSWFGAGEECLHCADLYVVLPSHCSMPRETQTPSACNYPTMSSR